MGDIVNLNRFRKERAKAERSREAEENRVRHGRSKAEKSKDSVERGRTKDDHDGKKLT